MNDDFSMKNILFLFLIAISISLPIKAQSVQEKPNIIFIFADDWSYADIGAHGSTWIQTPHIDKMINEGMDLSS